MRLCERIKLFTGPDPGELEEEFATWYDAKVAEREAVPALRGNRFNILERNLIIRQYDGEETFGLSISYEDVLLEEHERGSDRGNHLNNGVSLIQGKRR